MSETSDDYVYDEASGEWLPAGEAAARAAAADAVEVRDSAGNLLADGDSVVTIKDLKVKGAGQTLRKGTVIKSIRLTGACSRNCVWKGSSRASPGGPSWSSARISARPLPGSISNGSRPSRRPMSRACCRTPGSCATAARSRRSSTMPSERAT